MTRVLVIDNYDSFVYNIVQYLGESGVEPVVVRNDEIGVEEMRGLKPDGVLASPGPGHPEDAGVLCEAIAAFAGHVPILGVCLGHQAIGTVYGAEIVRAPELVHGKTSEVFHDGRGLFVDTPSPLVATRYHSLVIDPATIPEELEVTARTADDVVMAIRHRALDVEGVQFHPESILTTDGRRLLANFVARCA